MSLERGDHTRTAGTRLVAQTVESRDGEPLRPRRDTGTRRPERARDARNRLAGRGQEHHACPAVAARLSGLFADDPLELRPLMCTESDLHTGTIDQPRRVLHRDFPVVALACSVGPLDYSSTISRMAQSSHHGISGLPLLTMPLNSASDHGDLLVSRGFPVPMTTALSGLFRGHRM